MPPSARTLLLYYASQWEKKYGTRLAISWAKNTAQIKRLQTYYTDERLRALIQHYLFGFANTLAERSAHAIGAFVVSVNQVAASLAKAEELQQASANVHPDADLLEQARRRLNDE